MAGGSGTHARRGMGKPGTERNQDGPSEPLPCQKIRAGGKIGRRRPNKKPRVAAGLSEIVAVFVAGRNQAWNELPQPQDFTAFGLSNVKPRFSSPS